MSLAFEGFRGRRRSRGWDRGSIVSVRGRHEEEENEMGKEKREKMERNQRRMKDWKARQRSEKPRNKWALSRMGFGRLEATSRGCWTAWERRRGMLTTRSDGGRREGRARGYGQRQRQSQGQRLELRQRPLRESASTSTGSGKR